MNVLHTTERYTQNGQSGKFYVKYMLPGASQVAPVVKNLPANAGDVGDTGLNLCWADPLEEEMATHSSTFAWKMSWTEKSGGL